MVFWGLRISGLGKGKMSHLIRKQMTCYQVQHLMDLYIGNDPSLTAEKRKAFDSHLHNCQGCASKYKESLWIVGLIKESWSYEEENRVFLKRINHPNHRQEVIDQCWEEFKYRILEFTQLEKEWKYSPLFRHIGAVAACLIIGVSLFLVFSIYSKPKNVSESTSHKLASDPKPSVKIELISENGGTLIPANQQIASVNELKTLIINGKHRMVMNRNTVVAVEPLVENSNMGCLVKLTSGQVYTYVEHDTNPFLVETAHGKAVITGTTFDISVTDENTTLVVSEGTVEFESEQGVVKVSAGQISEIVGQSAPSIPLLCNTAELTAWATGYKAEPLLAQATNTDPWELSVSFGKEPIVLEVTDYDHWIEQKREWFRQNFPWIFKLKEALAKEDIEVDYPELLIKTGDVWQLAYLEVSPARFSIVDPNSLLKTASDYGFGKQWLLENVPEVISALEKPVLSENSFAGLKAFERWLEYLDETKIPTSPMQIYSSHASKYLADTRSLIWFAVRDGKYDLSDAERTEVLALLQKEVTAAYKYQNELFCSAEEQKLCCDDICQEPAGNVAGYIETIKTIEEKIAEYEIGK